MKKIIVGICILFLINGCSEVKENPNQEFLNTLQYTQNQIDNQMRCMNECDDMYDDCRNNLNKTGKFNITYTNATKDGCFNVFQLDCTRWCIENNEIPDIFSE